MKAQPILQEYQTSEKLSRLTNLKFSLCGSLNFGTKNYRKIVFLFSIFCFYYIILLSFNIDTNIKVHYKYQNFSRENKDYESESVQDFTKGEWDWQELVEIGGQDHYKKGTKFYVYSAYLEFYKGENILRIFSVNPSSSNIKLYCHVLDENLELMITVPAKIKLTVGSAHSRMYSPSCILCKLDSIGITANKMTQEIIMREMKYVSVSTGSLPSESNLLQILRIKDFVYDFGACVQPIFDYDKVFEFIQWIEYSKMMGVQHFTFYNMSIGPRVSCVMKSKAFNKETAVTILNWTMPINEDELLHNHCQLCQMNECAYRYRGVSKYVVNVDMDEFIIPNYYGLALNYKELLKNIDDTSQVSLNGKKIATYLFRSAFFSPGFEQALKDDFKNSDDVELEDLSIYRYTVRSSSIFGFENRAKNIFVPNLTVEPGLHYILEAVNDSVEVQVPYETAYLHHYRTHGCLINCSTNGVPEIDNSGQFFATELLQRVREMMKKLDGECGLKIKDLRS